MKLSDPLCAALCSQMTRERFAVAFYGAVGAAFDYQNLTGFSKWAWGESHEEQGHADKIREYVLDRNNPVTFDAVAAVALPDPSPLGLIAATLELERTVTTALRQLHAQARDEGDPDPETEIFLQWFLLEQVKAERKLEEYLYKLQMIADSNDVAALLALDHEVGEGEA